mmetsp:Transcript_41058/g.103113  ORF Transcript_41058/g.103113 Transcript_41058/m.103113 type:complete len:329 (+) Transcript_41058:2-988(+)
MLAAFHNAESALLFNSGFDANFAIFAYLPQPGDFVVFDELVHASVREGMRAGRAKTVSFKHNDVDALRSALRSVRAKIVQFQQQQAQQQAQQQQTRQPSILVAVETVYSMDGHCAPLVEMCDVAEEFGASVIADEAHGTGVFGEEGRGWAAELGVEHRLVCRVHTFGKGLGVHGAAMLGPRVMYEYLVNYARPLIYSTSLPMHSVASIRCAYAMMRRTAAERQRHLQDLVVLFHQRLGRLPPARALTSPSPIQGIIVPGNDDCVHAAQHLQRRGFHVLPIRSPTVPVGTERLRIILHYHNSKDEVNALMDAVEEVILQESVGKCASRL